MNHSGNGNSLSNRLWTHLRAWTARPAGRRLAQSRLLLPRIADFEAELKKLSDRELKQRSLSLRHRAKTREPLVRLLPECYALVRDAARRTLAMRHFDVQMLGGIALFFGSVAEMETGEGKTLTATLPLSLYALAGRGAHLATVNDYLAQRDAEWMRPVYHLLGLSVGVIQSDMRAAQRRRAYACDITYGTAKEIGFDFLRDRLQFRQQGTAGWLGSSAASPQSNAAGARILLGNGNTAGGTTQQPLQRTPYFALVDEADSILIDEARTPLIISASTGESSARAIPCYRWSAAVSKEFAEGKHYDYHHETKRVELTATGRALVRALPKPADMDWMGLIDIYEFVERAILVERNFLKDRHYVIRDGEIVIVDEFTGRLAEGRKWRKGIHSAVEAKENLTVNAEVEQAARITVQDLFLRYEHLAGMTGTAAGSRGEFRKIYDLRVVPIPTNRPSRRQALPPQVFRTGDEKHAAIVEEVRAMHAAGRPVLIGTRSIEQSERLSHLLSEAGIAHQVLNARHVADEAEIVARAGEPGRVTVATNMAGRGTDIKLPPQVAEAGGLYVICTEMHDSSRIDRQLIGRCGRQGDPGTFRQFLALDDEILLSGLGVRRAERLRSLVLRGPAASRSIVRLFRKAQFHVERRHFREREMLLFLEKRRQAMQQQMGQDPYLDTVD